MNELPRITVVVPLFNKGPHILRALDSVAAQALQPFEVIVVNDASTDDGPKQVEAFDKLPIKLLHRESPGPGGYAARNLGIENAEGDWIAFLDADDEWLADHLLNLASGITEGVGCVFSARKKSPGNRTSPETAQAQMLNQASITGDQFLQAWLGGRECPMWTGAIMVRRDVLETVGPFIEQGITRGGDKEMWLRIAAETNCAFRRKPTTVFYQDTVNRVSNKEVHTRLPAIVSTINKYIDNGKLSSSLLKRLKNREMAFYCRYTLLKRRKVPAIFVREAERGVAGFTRILILFSLSRLISTK
jgi:glycosyltransferase involved in cell wall biosynthesis